MNQKDKLQDRQQTTTQISKFVESYIPHFQLIHPPYLIHQNSLSLENPQSFELRSPIEETLELIDGSLLETSSHERIEMEDTDLENCSKQKPMNKGWIFWGIDGISTLASSVMDFVQEGLIDPHLE